MGPAVGVKKLIFIRIISLSSPSFFPPIRVYFLVSLYSLHTGPEYTTVGSVRDLPGGGKAE